MASVYWSSPDTESSSLVTTELDSLASGSTSSVFQMDNSTSKSLYAKIRVVLGSLTPTTNGYITLNIFGPNASGQSTAMAIHSFVPTTATGAKTLEKVIQIPGPFNFDCTITNNTGVAFNAADNDVYWQTFTEESA